MTKKYSPVSPMYCVRSLRALVLYHTQTVGDFTKVSPKGDSVLSNDRQLSNSPGRVGVQKVLLNSADASPE